MMVVAPNSTRLVEMFGTKYVVASGMTLTAVGLLLLTGTRGDSSYADLVWRMVITACGLALTMAPATESIMGSLPLAKAGVGSAVNDTTRQVGGAVGVAVIGSVFNSLYTSTVTNRLTALALPGDVVQRAKTSIGAALAASNEIGGANGLAVADAARRGFLHGMHTGLVVGSVAAVVGVTVTLVWLPSRARSIDLAQQSDGRDSERLSL
jgi:hypothetical protein